jgi:hypothetical protein
VLGVGCPRVTHPFAARAPFPKERASLDLHVLSTPPAFVLSQDQTLREGIWITSRSWIINTESCCLGGQHFESLVHSSWHLPRNAEGPSFSRMYQRNLFSGLELLRNRDEVFHGTDFRHAVEFSRSGRTPSQPFPAVRGQPTKHYSGQSTRVKPASARLPTWSPLTGSNPTSAARRAWGMSAPAPSRAPRCEQGEH